MIWPFQGGKFKVSHEKGNRVSEKWGGQTGTEWDTEAQTGAVTPRRGAKRGSPRAAGSRTAGN